MKLIGVILSPRGLNRFIFLTLISSLLAVSSNAIYGTTDDKILAGFLDGSYTGVRETQAVFIQPIFVFVISPLYHLMPIFGWYAISQLGMLICVMSLASTALDKVKPLLNNWFIALSMFTLIWHVPQITFTSTSMLVVLFSILVLFLYILTQERNESKILIVAVIMILGFYLRPEAALGILPIFILPFIKYLSIFRKISRKILSLLLLLVIFSFTINYIVQTYSFSSEWQQYNEWNGYRHQIQHRVAQDNLWKSLDKISWSPAEHNLFVSSSYGDPDTFNSSWLKPAFELSKSTLSLSVVFNSNISNFLDVVIGVLAKFLSEITFLFFLSALIFMIFRTFNLLILIFLIWLQGVFITYFMATTLHTPERVIIPLFVGCVIVCLLLTLDQSSIKLSYFKRINSTLLISFLVPIFLKGGFYDDFVDRSGDIEKSINVKQILGGLDKEFVFLGPVGTEVNHLVNPYISSSFDKELKLITVGNWETFSPHWYKRNLKLGVESKNVYKDLIKNPKVLWITQPLPDTAYQVELYLREQKVTEFDRKGVDIGLEGLNVFSFALDSP